MTTKIDQSIYSHPPSCELRSAAHLHPPAGGLRILTSPSASRRTPLRSASSPLHPPAGGLRSAPHPHLSTSFPFYLKTAIGSKYLTC
ncbi:MAG: hypothetical protein IPH88_15345 [Bacteroidales bacterium]|nr:hypothetical protein [Bacteroidales bacterium]